MHSHYTFVHAKFGILLGCDNFTCKVLFYALLKAVCDNIKHSYINKECLKSVQIIKVGAIISNDIWQFIHRLQLRPNATATVVY